MNCAQFLGLDPAVLRKIEDQLTIGNLEVKPDRFANGAPLFSLTPQGRAAAQTGTVAADRITPYQAARALRRSHEQEQEQAHSA